MLCGWAVKAGMIHRICGLNVWVAGKTVDPSLTPVIPELITGESLIIQRYTTARFTLTYLFRSVCAEMADKQPKRNLFLYYIDINRF